MIALKTNNNNAIVDIIFAYEATEADLSNKIDFSKEFQESRIYDPLTIQPLTLNKNEDEINEFVFETSFEPTGFYDIEDPWERALTVLHSAASLQGWMQHYNGYEDPYSLQNIPRTMPSTKMLYDKATEMEAPLPTIFLKHKIDQNLTLPLHHNLEAFSKKGRGLCVQVRKDPTTQAYLVMCQNQPVATRS